VIKCGRDELNILCSWNLTCGHSDQVAVDCFDEHGAGRFRDLS
jgi:hypothetical protein